MLQKKFQNRLKLPGQPAENNQDKNKVTIFQLLLSLTRRNVRRLLERPQKVKGAISSTLGDDSNEICTFDIRSTRKNLRDLLEDLLKVHYGNTFEFCQPFQAQGVHYFFTVMSNFTTQVCFLLLSRLRKHPDRVKEFRPVASKLWLVMLYSF